MSAIPEIIAAPQEKVRAVAKYQRWVILSLLFNIALIVYSFLMVSGVIQIPPALVAIIRLAAIAVIVFQLVSVILLAKQFTNIVLAIGAGILMFVPLISLIVLLVFNQKATAYLRTHGVHVGFLGVNPNSI